MAWAWGRKRRRKRCIRPQLNVIDDYLLDMSPLRIGDVCVSISQSCIVPGVTCSRIIADPPTDGSDNWPCLDTRSSNGDYSIVLASWELLEDDEDDGVVSICSTVTPVHSYKDVLMRPCDGQLLLQDRRSESPSSNKQDTTKARAASCCEFDHDDDISLWNLYRHAKDSRGGMVSRRFRGEPRSQDNRRREDMPSIMVFESMRATRQYERYAQTGVRRMVQRGTIEVLPAMKGKRMPKRYR